MTSVSAGAHKVLQVQARAFASIQNFTNVEEAEMMEQMTVMQGSIWEYSDSQPWFIAGLHKNNPTATRQALESIMNIKSPSDINYPGKLRGTLTLNDGAQGDHQTLYDSEGHEVSIAPEEETKNSKGMDSESISAQETPKRFIGSPELKMVIKKTVELIGDMNKSAELVFLATRACAKFLTYPTPSVPSDNFVFGHVKGWIWLIYKGLSHFNHDQTDKKSLDVHMKTFRKEMSLLAKEANGCVSDLNVYINDQKKLNVAIKKEAKLLRKQNRIWITAMDHYLRLAEEIQSKHPPVVDVKEDRFFPTEWIFEPHPSQTELKWDFFHFQWIDLMRDWIDCEFEVRSDYSLHWLQYSSFPPDLQTEIVVHLIHHLRALIEECHHFHQINMRLSFDSQEIKFLKFAIEEIMKLKKHREAVDFIVSITQKLFEDLTRLKRICEEYVTNLEWVAAIIEPCYYTMNRWLADDLIPPLEFSARSRHRSKWTCSCKCAKRKVDFLELFGDELKVVMLRSPISINQLEKFFPLDCYDSDVKTIAPPFEINSYGISRGYTSSIFDAGIGRECPLPIHHPLPKYKRHNEQKFNIFDINRLTEVIGDCKIEKHDKSNLDIDIEKYLTVIEEIQRFYAVFGTIFGFIIADIKDRVENLEQLIYNNLPEHYGTLVGMIGYEKSKTIDTLEKFGTKSILRLHKTFQFVVYFIEKANSLENTEITFYAGRSAYFRSYGKVQSWIYQKSATFSMYSLPTKQEMFRSLFAEVEDAEINKKVNKFVEQGCKLIDICEAVFKTNNIPS